MLIITTGFKPDIKLAKKCGLKCNNGIVVNECMETSDKNIYACGDCSEIGFLFNETLTVGLASIAREQARVIASNIVGKERKLKYVLNNTISKIGKLFIGSVGANEQFLKRKGINWISATYNSFNRARYFVKKEKVSIKVIADENGYILGSQIVSSNNIKDCLNLFALAIKKRIKLNEISELETCYNPAATNYLDEISIACNICEKKLRLKYKK